MSPSAPPAGIQGSSEVYTMYREWIPPLQHLLMSQETPPLTPHGQGTVVHCRLVV